MFSTTAFILTVEYNDLRQHVQQCADARGRLHRLRCTVEACDAFLAPRFVTTLGVMTLLMLAVRVFLP